MLLVLLLILYAIYDKSGNLVIRNCCPTCYGRLEFKGSIVNEKLEYARCYNQSPFGMACKTVAEINGDGFYCGAVYDYIFKDLGIRFCYGST